MISPAHFCFFKIILKKFKKMCESGKKSVKSVDKIFTFFIITGIGAFLQLLKE